jgi:hypothetical protein
MLVPGAAEGGQVGNRGCVGTAGNSHMAPKASDGRPESEPASRGPILPGNLVRRQMLEMESE